MEKKDLLRINPKDYEDRKLTPEEILHWFDLLEASWIHSGDPKDPHAELTTGLCTNGFFECMKVLCCPNLCEILAKQLVQKIIENGISKPDWVIGSPYAAITISYEVAKKLGATHGFTVKDPADSEEERMLWRRLTIPADSSILQVEELITTQETMENVRWAVEEGNSEPVNFLPLVATIVHRPPQLPFTYTHRKRIGGGLTVKMDARRVIALVEKEIWVADPEDCPLCQAGSPRYRPKANWKKLTGKY